MARRNAIRRPKERAVPDYAMVLIEQAPLRNRAAAKCSEAMARLERVRADWHHFERKDKPAFVRWRAREFGALLSRAREVEEEIRDFQSIIHEVELEMRRAIQDPYTAYQRVMFRRANPEGRPAEAGNAHRSAGAAERKLTDFEKEALFQEWIKRSLGTHPDKMDDDAYASSFEAFKTHMFRTPQEPPASGNQSAGSKRTKPAKRESPPPEVSEAATEVDRRVKELYRRLVRRLHPDTRSDENAAVSALWHEVQEAYMANDVAQLEILLALSGIETNRSAEQSLWQMQQLLAELERARWALEENLREAAREDAWEFARLGPNPALRQSVERQLRSALLSRKQRRDLLAGTIEEWAKGPAANRKVTLVR